MRPCLTCEGEGMLFRPVYDDDGEMERIDEADCPDCHGTGAVPMSDAEKEACGQVSLLGEGL